MEIRFMDVQYMTLDGRVDKDAFLDEWRSSADSLATFLQAGETVYIMPYGRFSPETVDWNVKFDSTYRRHTFVRRDFEITEEISVEVI